MKQVRIEIPTPLRAYTDNSKRVTIVADTIAKALDELVNIYPKLKPHLFLDDTIRSFVNIYLNDEDARYLEDKLHSTLNEGDVISIIPSIAGGL